MKRIELSHLRRFTSAHRIFAVSLLCAGGWLALSASLLAADGTYTGVATSGLDTTTNWSSGSVPASTTTTSDTATFDGTIAGALTLTEAVANAFGGGSGNLGALVNVTSGQTSSISIGGASIRLAGLTIASGAGAVTFTNNILFGGAAAATTNTIANNSANLLTFASMQGGGAALRTLDFTGTGAVTLSGAIGSGGTSIALQKDTTGVLTISNTNTYTGATTLNAGITKINNATALGSTAAGTTVASGATLQITTGGLTVAEALTISGAGASGGAGALETTTGTTTYSGLVTLGASSTIAADNGTTLNLTNTGTITGSGSTLTLAGSGTGSIASVIGTVGGGLSKTGAGTWTLTGADTSSGTTAISSGTLLVNNTTGSGAGSGTLTVSASATLGGTGAIDTAANAINIGNGTTGGTITGGTSGTIGTLTLTTTAANGVFFNGANASLSTYFVDVTSAGTDKLLINGVLNVSGANDALQINNISTLASGTYQLATYTSVSGLFDTVTGLNPNESLVYNSNGTELDLVVNAVPEPSTWAMMIGGMVILIGFQRFRRSAKR
jgi:fibronectin-binding autotransporter adhesin